MLFYNIDEIEKSMLSHISVFEIQPQHKRSWYISHLWTPGVYGIWGETLFIFREQGSTGDYFSGAWEQAFTLGI